MLAQPILDPAIVSSIFDSFQYEPRVRLLDKHQNADAILAEAPLPPLCTFMKLPYDGITANLNMGRFMHAVIADLSASMRAEGLAHLLPHLDRVVPMMCWQRARPLGPAIMRSKET